MTTVDTPTASSGRKIDWWLDQYAICHKNHTNKLIHYVCVPAIAACVLGLFWAIPMPGNFPEWINGATIVTLLAILFYLRLSPVLAAGMFVFTLPVLGLFYWLTVSGNAALVWQGSLVVFVIAWIFQFIGHKIEGAKPAFFEDVQFLMIGPIWILAHFLGKLGIKY